MKKLQILNSSLLVLLILIGLYIISNQLYDYKAVKTVIRINDDYAKRILLDPDVINKQVYFMSNDTVAANHILDQLENNARISRRIIEGLRKKGIMDDASYQNACLRLEMRQL